MASDTSKPSTTTTYPRNTAQMIEFAVNGSANDLHGGFSQTWEND
jgi:hypothetical protein